MKYFFQDFIPDHIDVVLLIIACVLFAICLVVTRYLFGRM